MKIFGFPLMALVIGAAVGYVVAARFNVKIPLLAP